VIGVWQRHPQTGQLIGLPRGKLVYLVEDTLTDSPERCGSFGEGVAAASFRSTSGWSISLMTTR